MKVRQLSVLIENETGTMSGITSLLGEAGVDIRGFSLCDTGDHGVLRLIVDQPDKAAETLRSHGSSVTESDVICVDLADKPGSLANALKVVSDAGVNIEYVFSLVSASVVLNVSDPDRALELLEGEPLRLVSQRDVARA